MVTLTEQRLLVVSSHSKRSDQISEMLRGNRIFTARSLREGCTAASNHRPAAAVVELDLPDCTGVDCVHRMREASEDIAIIGLGRYHDDQLSLDCISAGAQSYLGLDELQTPLLRRAVEYSIYRLREAIARQRADSLRGQLVHAQRLESLGLMAAGIAHDLNNTLQPVLMVLPLLRSRLGDPDAIEAIDMIHDATIRSRDLVREIVHVGRSESAEALHSLCLDEFIADIGSLLTAGLPPYIQLRIEVEPAPPINAYRNKLYQIVLNLVTNAAQAISTRQGEIVIGVTEDPDASAVLLSVRDNGPGMDQETIDRIFDPFFTTKQNEGGSGLGLAVVNQAVENIGGNISVHSRPGEGTQFLLRFATRQREEKNDQ
ncbi:sensor histidine kinase [Stakelama tenebrarum]|uniref:histidine kinase n=1 Tax=Stakelama tenebrarum TaxID=2711215 RepID=A0A6G6Y7Z1_9SPHN|nr:ATP-binding protein [Sphingosinithalassobacter tenebrarum]QIG81045.1 response regulator [Sphingosinithalassobacter tenebrarum]